MEEENFRHTIELQLRFNDFDVFGHVNNAVYQHYFDLARLDYFKELIEDKLKWNDFSVIMASININYKNPVYLDEDVSIRSKISIIGEKSLTMVQEVYNSITGEKKACNTAIMVGYSTKSKQSELIPDIWKERIFKFEEKVEFKYQ